MLVGVGKTFDRRLSIKDENRNLVPINNLFFEAQDLCETCDID